MIGRPKHLELPGFFEKLGIWAGHNLNFYRVHMICFTVIPFIFSGIFYACNTEYHIDYLDCLFLCFSSFCVTGLATVNLSTLSTFQQFLIYFQMLTGSMIFVSIIMVSVRKHFFRVQFRHVLQERNRRQRALELARSITTLPSATTNNLRRRFTRRPSVGAEEQAAGTPLPKKKKGPSKLTKDMIQRVDGGGVGLVNPMGWYDGATPTHSQLASRAVSPDPDAKVDSVGTDDVAKNTDSPSLHMIERATSAPSVRSQGSKGVSGSGSGTDKDAESPAAPRGRRMSTTTTFSQPSVDKDATAYSGGVELRPVLTTDTIPLGPEHSNTEPMRARTPYSAAPAPDANFPRSKTIAFDEQEDGLEHILHPGREPGYFPRTPTNRSETGRVPRYNTNETLFPRTNTLRRSNSRFMDTKTQNFGGFPTPFQLAADLFHKLFPGTTNKLQQTLTMPRTNTLLSGRQDDGEGKNVDYITFAATVGRNSLFHNLTDEQMDELGGVEYRALRLLFWIVLTYWICWPLAGATVIAPYIAAGNRYDNVFNSQPKHVRIPWFAFFQATSGFSNTGMSLVDQSMVPFQHAPIMSIVVALLILLGNTCFPIMLRFIIWILFKTVPKTSQMRDTLKFLLDHPRRCFVYLFPSTQTWFLFLVVITLTFIDWVCFIVLDLGNPIIEEIPGGARTMAGLFQACAVRAAGFAIVSMNQLAPAVKVLYVIMMYVSVYPIAMSVRATNVYEERALGVYEEEESDDEDEFSKQQGAHAVAKYLGWHARRQLAFDMWWVALSLWLVCIIERTALTNPENFEWMNIFNVLFEIVSAYGTVGLSLGIPDDNYSLSGKFRKLSKLVIIVVMLRGRHRGLPVAIDRAVMLPKDFAESDERALESRLRRSRSRRASSAGDIFSQGSAFPRTFTGMSDTVPNGNPPNGNAGVGVVPPSPRLPARDSSPSSPFRRLGRSMSHGSSVGDSPNASSQNPMTPTSLQFALSSSPHANTQGLSSFGTLGTPTATPGVTGSGFPSSSQHPNQGILSPVQEDLSSRRPTLTEAYDAVPTTATTGHTLVEPSPPPTAGAPTSEASTGSATAVQDSPPILTPELDSRHH